jgi:Flp pilus assembly protein TadG
MIAMLRFFHETVIQWASAQGSRLFKDKRGVVVIEFAFILPLMLTMWLGSIELSQIFTANRKAELTARTLADLIARFPGDEPMETKDFQPIWSSILATMAPLDNKIVSYGYTHVAFSNVESGGKTPKATVCWSQFWKVAPNGGKMNSPRRLRGSVVDVNAIPAHFRTKNTTLIWTEVEFNYTPFSSWLLKDDFVIKSQSFMWPRSGKPIAYSVDGARGGGGLPNADNECL